MWVAAVICAQPSDLPSSRLASEFVQGQVIFQLKFKKTFLINEKEFYQRVSLNKDESCAGTPWEIQKIELLSTEGDIITISYVKREIFVKTIRMTLTTEEIKSFIPVLLERTWKEITLHGR
jgi:hypothetical protein